MNATQQARTGYGTNALSIRTPRDTEYEAFARVTSRLKSAAASRPPNMSTLASAIHENRRLWIMLAANAADNGNRLPERTRAQILSLAEFTRQHSGKILASRASVSPLIDVNTAIMRGLRGVDASTHAGPS